MGRLVAFEDSPLIDVPVPHEERVARLVARTRSFFGRVRPTGLAEAPGRVNLIGEHVDYNDGLVLPFAINRSVMCAWSREDDIHSFTTSLDFAGDDRFIVDSIGPSPGTWMAYPRGVLKIFLDDGLIQTRDRPIGLNLAFQGDVPSGAGLSSSAAVELATAGAADEASESKIAASQLAVLCQRAENEYVGVQCGIMDQFASALSKRDHALLIDCRTLAYQHVPLRLAEHGLAIVIANSAVRRELITSAYNDRRRECEEAVVRLRDVLRRPRLKSLRDVRSDEIAGIEIAGDDAVLRRARHVVTEIDRVAEAVDALERDDFARLGELMVASHLSLKTDYEVSSEELDLLVGLATAQEYVLGARLTGAGFGGCTVNLVRAVRVEDFARDVIVPYRERTGLQAVMYVTEACDGLRTWRL
jgi:galactokinase